MLARNRLIFLSLWLVLIFSGPITVLRNSNIDLILQNKVVLLNTLQRIVGLLAYTLLFTQIIVGSLMDRWVQILGAKAYRVHVIQGVISYAFIFVHPLFYYLINYVTLGKVVLIPDLTNIQEIWISLGRIALLVLTATIWTAYFRTRAPLRRNWRILHIVNYFVFYLIFLHSFLLGTDAQTAPFVWIYWLAFIAVSATVIFRIYQVVRTNKILSAQSGR